MAEKQSKSTSARKTAAAEKPKATAKEPGGRKRAATAKKTVAAPEAVAATEVEAAAKSGAEAPEQVDRGQATRPVALGNPAVDTVRSWSGLSPSGGLTLQQVAERLHVTRAIAGDHLREAVEAGLVTLDQNGGVYRLAETPTPAPAPVAEIVPPEQVDAVMGPVMAHMRERYRQWPHSGQIVQDVVVATGLDRRAIYAALERGVASGELVREDIGYRLAASPAPEPASEELVAADPAETPAGDAEPAGEEPPAPETSGATAAEATGAEAEPEDTSAAPSDVPAVADVGAAGGAFNAAMPIDSVIVVGNVRKHFDDAALAELAHDIKVNGILQPLLVRTGPDLPAGQFALVAGERRLRAARVAGLATVPVIIREMDARTAARAQLLENVHRADLNAIEEAEGYAALLQDHGYTQTALAKELGVSQPHIANRLRLMRLPEAARELISRGMLPAATALSLVRVAEKNAAAADRAAKDMVTAKVASAKADEWVDGWLASNMPKLEGWEAKCCGDHKNCPCRVVARQWGQKVPVCLDPKRFKEVEEAARQALIEATAAARPQAVAGEPVPPPKDPLANFPVQPVAAKPEQGEEAGDAPAAATPAEPPAPKPEVLDLRQFQSHMYTYLCAAQGDNAPPECQQCPCLRLAQRRPGDRLEWVCIDPKRHQAEERRRTRAKTKAAMETLSTERERHTHWAAARVQETWNPDLGTPALGKVDLAYLAAWILTAAKPEYGPNSKPRANLREYLAGFSVTIDNAAATFHSHQGLAGQLLSVEPSTLWRMCVEWPLLAQGHGLGRWYRRKVDMPEGEACDICSKNHDDLEPSYCRRAEVVPEGGYVMACPKCRSLANLSRFGFYQEEPEGVELVRITKDQIDALLAAEERANDDEGSAPGAGPRGACALCDDVFPAGEMQRLYNHRWDGAPRGAYMDVCAECTADREESEPDAGGVYAVYGFLREPPQEGEGEALTEEQVTELLEQEAEGLIDGHLSPASAAADTGPGDTGEEARTEPASA